MLQFVQPNDYCLDEGGERERIVDTRLRIANANFQRVEKWMQPNVPPDFLRVIDAAGFDEQFAVVFILGKALKCVWNPGARKTFEHLQSITLETSVVTDPKR